MKLHHIAVGGNKLQTLHLLLLLHSNSPQQNRNAAQHSHPLLFH